MRQASVQIPFNVDFILSNHDLKPADAVRKSMNAFCLFLLLLAGWFVPGFSELCLLKLTQRVQVMLLIPVCIISLNWSSTEIIFSGVFKALFSELFSQ